MRTRTKSLLFGAFVILLLQACGTTEPVLPREGSGPAVQGSETYGVQVTEGVIYAEGLSHDTWNGSSTTRMQLPLDVYEPIGAPDGRPAIIIIHGGGFHSGSRAQGSLVDHAEYFASRGWVAFSIDYRLERNYGTLPSEWVDFADANFSGGDREQVKALYPAGRDAKAAVRWVYSQADTYAINTDYITVMGGSAGAYLSVMLGTTEEEDYRDELSEVDDATLSTTNLDQPAKVHTIIDYWGGDGLVDALQTVYGHNRFDALDAPIMIAHGDKDDVVLFTEAEDLQAAYEETGVNYAFYHLDGQKHGAWGAKYDGKYLDRLSFDFIVEQQDLTIE